MPTTEWLFIEMRTKVCAKAADRSECRWNEFIYRYILVSQLLCVYDSRTNVVSTDTINNASHHTDIEYDLIVSISFKYRAIVYLLFINAQVTSIYILHTHIKSLKHPTNLMGIIYLIYNIDSKYNSYD